jgi:hypothetical protein
LASPVAYPKIPPVPRRQRYKSKAKLGDTVTKHSTHPGNPDLELHLADAEEQDVLAAGIDLLLVKAPILLGQNRRR